MADAETVQPEADLKAVVEAAIDEQAGKDETKASPKEPQAQATAKAPDAPAEGADQQLISDEEFDSLKNDPAQVRKRMNQSYTQKTQAVAEEKKQLSIERGKLSEAQGFLDAYSKDPVDAVTRLAGHHGLRVALEAAGAVEEAKEEAGLDEDDELTPAAQKYIDKRFKQQADEQAQRDAEQAQRDAVVREAETTKDLEEFDKRRPGWREHEAAMVALGRRLKSKPTDTTLSYMEELYSIVTGETKLADAAAETVERITSSASEAEPFDTSVAASKVVAIPDKPLSLDESFKMAERGEVVDWSQ